MRDSICLAQRQKATKPGFPDTTQPTTAGFGHRRPCHATLTCSYRYFFMLFCLELNLIAISQYISTYHLYFKGCKSTNCFKEMFFFQSIDGSRSQQLRWDSHAPVARTTGDAADAQLREVIPPPWAGMDFTSQNEFHQKTVHWNWH